MKLALLVLFVVGCLHVKSDEECNEPLDLVFALDASYSVKYQGFSEIQLFTKEFIDGFDIGVDDTHVGVLTFHNKGKVRIGLTTYFEKDDFFREIDALKYVDDPKCATNISGALDVVEKSMFSASGGARENVHKVLIFLTDGHCTRGRCENKDIKKSADFLKNKGITIFTVGVTDEVNENELELISSSPSDQHMFFVDNFPDLRKKVKELQQKSRRIHGRWGDWRKVGACSASCGGGKQLMERSCDNPKPSCGGNPCQGHDWMKTECNTNGCPVTCKIGDSRGICKLCANVEWTFADEDQYPRSLHVPKRR